LHAYYTADSTIWQLAYWIDGKPRPDDTPRWNLLDNVLRPAWRRL
jgi:hypothetical protein